MADKSPAEAGPLSATARATLERVCAELAGRADHRGVIRLVDRWASLAEPSREALLAQAQALLALRLMDRAWLRLSELSARAPDDAVVVALTAELFIERGWPARARKLVAQLAELEPGHPRLAELEAGAAAPPRGPDPNAKELERTGTPLQQLEQAERFQAAGSLLRAKSILERLRRQPGPWSPRVEDLLWGLDADFAQDDIHPLALARELAPDATAPPDDERAEHTESSARPETEELDLDPPPAFPALFRRMEEPTAETDTQEERTAVSIVADRQRAQAHEPVSEEEGPAARDGDTQIMLVVHKDGTPSQGHRVRDGQGYNLRETLNLREYQASMGLRTADPAAADEVALEEEDEELIIVTRREPEAPAAPASAGPVQVVERPLGPLPPPPPSPIALTERAPPPRPAGGPAPSPPAAPPAAPRPAPRAAARPAATSRAAVVGALALVALAMIGVGVALLWVAARVFGQG